MSDEKIQIMAKKFEDIMSGMVDLSDGKISKQKEEVSKQLEDVKNLCSAQIDRAKNEIAASLVEAKKIASEARVIKDASLDEIKKAGEIAKKESEKTLPALFKRIDDIDSSFKKALDDFKTNYIARTDECLRLLSDEIRGSLPLVHALDSRGKRLAQGLETLSRAYLNQEEKKG